MLSALLIFIFLSPLPFLLVISLCHLSTSTSICRALKCPAGQTDAGLDRSGKVIWDASCTQAHTHKRTRTHTLITDTPGQQTHTPPFFALWPACLHFHWSASTLPNGFFSSSILLHLFSLCVIQNNKCSGPRRIHRQIFHLTLAWISPPPHPFLWCFFGLSVRSMQFSFTIPHPRSPSGSRHLLAWVQRWDDRMWLIALGHDRQALWNLNIYTTQEKGC